MLNKTIRKTDTPDDSEELVTIGVFNSTIEADLLREELYAAGIDAWVAGATIAQTFVTLPETGIQVEVRVTDESRAREVAAGIQIGETPSDDAEAGG